MSRHFQHRCEHSFIERRRAKLVVHKVVVYPDLLDHVPAQDCEMHFIDRFHESPHFFRCPCRNGVLDRRASADGSQSVAGRDMHIHTAMVVPAIAQ
jgi:hypothetical protein